MKDQWVLGTLGLVPKNLLSRAVGAAAHAPFPAPVRRLSVWAFARAYDIDVAEAELPLSAYATVGEFFTRRLRPGARSIDRRPGIAVSPADGRLLNCGRIDGGELIQAKGRRFSLAELLQNRHDAERFAGGCWATVYLSPRDYHRVHHPSEGEVVAARYLPGHLWPVNRAAVENIEDLFCVNERVTTYVQGPLGEVATIMVGATSVGHITLSYDPTLETNRGLAGGPRSYTPGHRMARGDELGTFHLGSTAIVLFANPKVQLEPLEEGQPMRLGQVIARLR